MFGLGMWELVVILLIVVILFGANRLPLIGDGIGKMIANFRQSVKPEDRADEKPPIKAAALTAPPKKAAAKPAAKKAPVKAAAKAPAKKAAAKPAAKKPAAKKPAAKAKSK